jgi:histidine triad (HIT) family protein
MSDCVFCKIVGGEIPAFKVYEDANFLAFLDVNPRMKGHTLIIPKHHASTLLELPDNQVRGIFLVVKKVAASVTKALGAPAFTIGSNNGETAGQAVPHLHIHIIPRYNTDKHKAGFEAAFPVNDSLKKDLDKTSLSITRGSTIPPIETSQPPKKESRQHRELALRA